MLAQGENCCSQNQEQVIFVLWCKNVLTVWHEHLFKTWYYISILYRTWFIIVTSEGNNFYCLMALFPSRAQCYPNAYGEVRELTWSWYMYVDAYFLACRSRQASIVWNGTSGLKFPCFLFMHANGTGPFEFRAVPIL